MKYMILIQNPITKNIIPILKDGEASALTFESTVEAQEYIENSPSKFFMSWDWEIVEIEYL